jgi:hypothetical protein
VAGLAGIPIPGETGSHEATPGDRNDLMVTLGPCVRKMLLQ